MQHLDSMGISINHPIYHLEYEVPTIRYFVAKTIPIYTRLIDSTRFCSFEANNGVLVKLKKIRNYNLHFFIENMQTEMPI